ncbi:MAG: hypothetical protein ACPLSJ_06615 [Thermosulfidibacteraceae bacterium]
MPHWIGQKLLRVKPYLKEFILNPLINEREILEEKILSAQGKIEEIERELYNEDTIENITLS